MKIAANIAGGLLGLLFITFSSMVLFHLVAIPPLPEGTPAYWFMKAFAPTGYLTFVKSLEMLGGILVAIPYTRNIGLLILGPIIVNILAYHAFVMGGEGLFSGPVILISVLAAFLLWVARRSFAGLLN